MAPAKKRDDLPAALVTASHSLSGPDAEGWMHFAFVGAADPDIYVQPMERDGRLIVGSLRFESRRGLTSEDLRKPRLTIPAIEASLNSWAMSKKAPARRVPLRRPATRPYPDEFFEAVAQEYLAIRAAGRSPGPAIAEMTGAPVPTVHGWVREARRRGLLHVAPGRGQAG